ncbi:hypothetical protein CC80DRAFT_515071 [Byssothecium circinans]|uniref:Uncharacterized protein n=1 Tax=Byssothecium circinans TaxID=147558 RepID=A0A6A5U081_9PLEO|nr:hypothetical protein CC80DRAFT_515071 [Byssothecium circinans]
MPPSSARRVGLRSRREPDAQQQSDADTPDSIATPSRKRRRVGDPPSEDAKDARSHMQLNGVEQAAPVAAEDAARTRITESVASDDSRATIPNGADNEVPTDALDRQNYMIQHLRTPSTYVPHAAVDFANDLQLRKMEGDNVPAYAKIAARDWCFFVQKTRFIIGRADSAIRANPHDSSHHDMPALPPSDAVAVSDWGVDIDLGPERQVSRVHAQVDYDSSLETWFITVNSRNGLKLDDFTLARGDRAPLHSGICIGILGTQMVFLLPGQEDVFHPMLYRQLKTDREVNESDDDGNPPNRTLPHAHPNGPTPKREPYDPFPPTSSRNRQAAQAQAQGHQLTSTPGRPLPNTPMAFRSSEKHPRSQDSPAFPRGMLLDSTESIDLSNDAAKDTKPNLSYAQLIGQAILNSPDEMLTLANIYDYIKAHYAYFRHTSAGWQNSIRHNLSLNKSFEKIARRTDEPGKGMKWKIADSERDEFIKKTLLNPRNKAGSGQSFPTGTSGPSSPALGNQSAQREYREPFHASERLQGALDQNRTGYIKSPPRSATPPLSSIPTATQSFTPERGPRSQIQMGGYGQSTTFRDQDRFVTPAKKVLFPDPEEGHQPAFAKTDGEHGGLESSPSVEPVKQNVSGLRDEAANSPPTLYSDTPANNTSGNQEAHRANTLVTPFVTRHAPRLAPPSTAQMPSHYINFSSPAPFWKFVDLPSTPAKAPVDLSPIKMRHDSGKDGDEEPAQPSSPPIMGDEEPSAEPEEKADEEEEDVGPESPSRTVSRPVSRQVGSHRSRSNSNINGFDPKPVNGGMVRGASLTSFEEEPEEEGFDLSK